VLDYEKKYLKNQQITIVGIDEAGRGCLAGPVVASAIILPRNYRNEAIDDSKKLTCFQRLKLYDELINIAIDVGIGIIDARTIDQINIYHASKQAMLVALKKLKSNYDLIITDAMKLGNLDVPVIPLVKGDQKSLNVAAASIIAKVTRDKIMTELNKKYPKYEFTKHKGYPTKIHQEALLKYGPIIDVHRFSYKPVKKVANLIVKK
jgi:ribonuclease HII